MEILERSSKQVEPMLNLVFNVCFVTWAIFAKNETMFGSGCWPLVARMKLTDCWKLAVLPSRHMKNGCLPSILSVTIEIMVYLDL